RTASGGGADEQPHGAAATGPGVRSQHGADQQDGDGGWAPERDRECAGIAACEPGDVYPVACAGGSAATWAAWYYRWEAPLYWAWGFASFYIIAEGVVFLSRFCAGKWKSMRVIEAAPG